MKIILASGSPRRRQLLAQAGITFEVLVSGADETIEGPPAEQVAGLARRKALATAALYRGESRLPAEPPAARCAPPAIIIAADTLVALEPSGAAPLILGKPKDAKEAFAMLSALQGRKHTVYTGVALLPVGEGTKNKEEVVFVEAADVFFRALSEKEIRAYIATGEPFDKAGAYGIQEKGAMLVERVEGDFYTVMGLPIARLCVALGEMGIDVWGESTAPVSEIAMNSEEAE